MEINDNAVIAAMEAVSLQREAELRRTLSLERARAISTIGRATTDLVSVFDVYEQLFALMADDGANLADISEAGTRAEHRSKTINQAIQVMNEATSQLRIAAYDEEDSQAVNSARLHLPTPSPAHAAAAAASVARRVQAADGLIVQLQRAEERAQQANEAANNATSRISSLEASCSGNLTRLSALCALVEQLTAERDAATLAAAAAAEAAEAAAHADLQLSPSPDRGLAERCARAENKVRELEDYSKKLYSEYERVAEKADQLEKQSQSNEIDTVLIEEAARAGKAEAERLARRDITALRRHIRALETILLQNGISFPECPNLNY